MGNDCCCREDKSNAEIVDLKSLYIHPTMSMPIATASKVDNKGTASPVKFRGLAQELQEPD